MILTIEIPSWMLWAAGNLSGLAAIFFLFRRQLAEIRERHEATRRTLSSELAAAQVELAKLSRLYIVGRHVRGNHWDVQGVFSERDKAVAACKNPRYFLFPLDLDQDLPEESTVPFKIEYPKGGE